MLSRPYEVAAAGFTAATGNSASTEAASLAADLVVAPVAAEKKHKRKKNIVEIEPFEGPNTLARGASPDLAAMISRVDDEPLVAPSLNFFIHL
jgi:hypothetical protein